MVLLNISQIGLYLPRSSSNKNHGQVENVDVSDISDFSPTFINLTFPYSPVVRYENLDV